MTNGKFIIALSLDDFQRWLRRDRKGERCIYHTGYHLNDVGSLRDAVWRAYQAGLCRMFQIRSEEGSGFHYMAERV